MTVFYFAKLGDRSMDSIQSCFQQEAQGSGSACFL
jgi:hypothetical protein